MTKTPSKTKTPPKDETPSGPSSQDLLDTFLKDNEADHFAYVKPANQIISTGSLLLDSYVKIRSGGVVRLVGKGAELGKTSESFVIADSYMKTMPKSKTIFIKAESRLSPEMQARSGLRFVFTAAEWDYGTVFVLPINRFEKMAELFESILPEMHEQGEHLCAIIDSLDGLILKADSTKDVWGEESVKVAGVPLLTKLFFRRLGLAINHYDALFLITGQYSAAIKLDPYAPGAPRQVDSSGGNAIAHQSDYVFEYAPRYGGDWILQNPDEKPDPKKNPIIGVWATIDIKKSGTDVSGTKLKVPIRRGRVGSAIWVEKEVVDMALQWSFVKRAGAWFSFEPSIIKEAKEAGVEVQEKVQGLNALYTYFETDRAVFEWFFAKFKALIAT